MDFNEYQQEAITTAIYPQELKVIYPALGLAGETGEVVDKIKKTVRDHGGDFASEERRQAIVAEMGDVLWYLAAMSHDLGVPLSEVARKNIAKLRSRRQRNALHGEGDNR